MESQSRKRRRPALSCLECRRRKIKCDRSQPCAHCVSSRSQCTFKVYSNDPIIGQQPQQASSSSGGTVSSPTAYAPTPLSQPPLTSTDICTDKPAPRRSYYPFTTPGITAATAAAGGHHDTPNTPSRHYSRPQTGAQDLENTQSTLQDLLKRVQTLESSASSFNHRQSETGQEILERQPGIQDSQVILKKTRVLKWSDWIGQTEEVKPISISVPQPSANQGSSSNQFITATLPPCAMKLVMAIQFRTLKLDLCIFRSVIFYRNANL